MTAAHTCAYSWCTNDLPDHLDHFFSGYTCSSREPLRPKLTVGALVWTDNTHPEIVDVMVRLVEQDGDIDEQIVLSVDDAKALFITLAEVIEYAVAAEAVAQ